MMHCFFLQLRMYCIKIHWRPQESLQAGRDLVAGTLADTSIHDRGRVIQMTVGTMIPMSATSGCAVEDTWFARAVHVSKNGRMAFTTTGRAWHQLRARLEIWEISDLIIRHEDGVVEIHHPVGRR